MPGAYRHDAMLKVNHDGNLKRLERIRDQANERVTLANDAARKAATRLSKKTLDRIRKKRGEQARERDRPDYSKMNPHKVLAARVFHQLYELTVKQRKRAIDVFRDFDTDDSGTVDRAEFAAGCKSLGMDIEGVAASEIFDACDEDGSGELDYWEVEKAIKRAGKYPPPSGPVKAVDPKNIVATHFNDMHEGFRAILKFKQKLRKTREVEAAAKTKRIHNLQFGKGDDSSSSEDDNNDDDNDNESEKKDQGKASNKRNKKKKKKNKKNAMDAVTDLLKPSSPKGSSEDEYSEDDYEDEFEDDDDFEEDDEEKEDKGKAQAPVDTSVMGQLRHKLTSTDATNESDDDDEPKDYTLKDLAMWVNMDDPHEIINNPQVARAMAAVPTAVRRVAAKLHNLMKRERLGIRTMFQCLDTDGSGILEVKELHDGLLQYLDIDLSLEDLKSVLDHCDKSMDGQISFDEFEKAFLWADMKRMARLVKRQNHADRRHYKLNKRHRAQVLKERKGGNIYRVPDATPLPTKEEQASFPDGRPRELPFWLRPRDSPFSKPWHNSNLSKEDSQEDGGARDRATARRKVKHQERCVELNVKPYNLTEVVAHKKLVHASDILNHMEDAEKKLETKKASPKKTKPHHRHHIKTLPSEANQPLLPPRITTDSLEATMNAQNNQINTNTNGTNNNNHTRTRANRGGVMVQALKRRRERRQRGENTETAIQQQQQTSPTQMRMLDAQNLYSTPPMLYGAKEGQGFSTSPPHKSKLPKHTNKNHNSATASKKALLSAMRAVGILEDKINAQHIQKDGQEIFNFRVVVMQQNGNKAPQMRPSTAIIGEDGVKTHLASWNPIRVGVQVSPADAVDENRNKHSPQLYYNHPRQSNGGKPQQIERLVLLERIPRRQLLRKKNVRRKVLREVQALQRVHGTETHRFIQRIIATIALPTELIVVKLNPEGGTLRQLLTKLGKAGTLGVKPTRFYAAELVSAIEYIHKKGILHRDIKLENVRLGSDGHVILSGFSLALPDFAGIEHEIVGSPQCMAPEMIAGEGYGRCVDWWGLGVLIHDMLMGESPFNADTPEKLFYQITHPNVKLGPQFSENTRSFVEGLLVRKPQNRLGGTNRGEFGGCWGCFFDF